MELRRAPLKEVLGEQYNYRKGEKVLQATGLEENDSVVRIRAPRNLVAGARIQVHSTG